MEHIPVLCDEVIELLSPNPVRSEVSNGIKEGGIYLDTTTGLGGHGEKILKDIPESRLFCLDKDEESLSLVRERLKKFGKRVFFGKGDFRNLKRICERLKLNNFSGILYDLGLSSFQIKEEGRGFTFLKNEPLDMRFDLSSPEKASDLLNHLSKEELNTLFKRYGDFKRPENLVEKIIKIRREKPILWTEQLLDILPKRRGRIHPATRIFMALRIAVNDELGALRESLPQAVSLLKKEGRLIIISYHSLEDRVVKEFFQKEPSMNTLTRHPIRPTSLEVVVNRRSRSAKLRAAEKTDC